MGANDKVAATFYPEEKLTRVPRAENDPTVLALTLLEGMVDFMHTYLTPDLYDDLDDDFNTIATQLNKGRRLDRQIKNALEMMDHSAYGDPEVPFRMRALLDPK